MLCLKREWLRTGFMSKLKRELLITELTVCLKREHGWIKNETYSNPLKQFLYIKNYEIFISPPLLLPTRKIVCFACARPLSLLLKISLVGQIRLEIFERVGGQFPIGIVRFEYLPITKFLIFFIYFWDFWNFSLLIVVSRLNAYLLILMWDRVSVLHDWRKFSRTDSSKKKLSLKIFI